MFCINILPEKLYEGCLLAALAHAVTVGEYPAFNYEHSWDGINYCLNNSAGCRGTITFHPKYSIAAFRDESKVDDKTYIYHWMISLAATRITT